MYINSCGLFSLFNRIILNTAKINKYKILFDNSNDMQHKDFYFSQYCHYSKMDREFKSVLADLNLTHNYNNYVNTDSAKRFYQNCVDFLTE